MIGGREVYLRVGLLIVGGGMLLAALVWFLAGSQIRHGILFESYFAESVQGLNVGTEVKYRGVAIGRVTDLGLVSAEYGGLRPLDPARPSSRLVFARFEIDTARIGKLPDTATAVALGLRVRLASQGITGLSYLELDFADPRQYPALAVPWEPRYTYIPSMPSTLTQVQDAAQQVLAKLDRVDLDRLSGELSGLVAELRSELAAGGDLHQTLTAATTLLRTMNDTMHTADLPGLTADLKRSSTALRDTVQGDDMRKLLANGALAAERLAGASGRLPALIASLDAMARRTNNGTSDIEQTLIPVLRDIQATTQSLRELTGTLQRYPAQVFSGPPPRTERAR